jgi:hypothetical protein
MTILVAKIGFELVEEVTLTKEWVETSFEEDIVD